MLNIILVIAIIISMVISFLISRGHLKSSYYLIIFYNLICLYTNTAVSLLNSECSCMFFYNLPCIWAIIMATSGIFRLEKIEKSDKIVREIS